MLCTQLRAFIERPETRLNDAGALPVLVTLNAIVSDFPGRTYVVSFEMSTVTSKYSPAITRVVSVKLYPLPADVMERVTMSMSDKAAFCGTLTTTPRVVVAPAVMKLVVVLSKVRSAQPRLLFTLMSKLSVFEPVFLMM